jgi:hypothetical protein
MLNIIEFNKPFVLVLGRKRQVITAPARLEQTLLATTIEYDDGGRDTVITGEQICLFINDKLFSTSITTPRKRYSRFSLKVVKPKRKRMEIHLTKKLNQFAV